MAIWFHASWVFGCQIQHPYAQQISVETRAGGPTVEINDWADPRSFTFTAFPMSTIRDGMVGWFGKEIIENIVETITIFRELESKPDRVRRVVRQLFVALGAFELYYGVGRYSLILIVNKFLSGSQTIMSLLLNKNSKSLIINDEIKEIDYKAISIASTLLHGGLAEAMQSVKEATICAEKQWINEIGIILGDMGIEKWLSPTGVSKEELEAMFGKLPLYDLNWPVERIRPGDIVKIVRKCKSFITPPRIWMALAASAFHHWRHRKVALCRKLEDCKPIDEGYLNINIKGIFK